MSDQRVSIVTGAGRGIGSAIALRLAKEGFAVAVNYATSASGAQNVVDEIIAGGGQAVAIQADISQATQAERLVSQTSERLGPPTVLINNAGANRAGAVVKQAPEDWDAVIAINLSGAVYCSHYALPHMYEAGWGRVIFVTSPVGTRRPAAGMSAYSAAKAGLVGVTRCLSQETARRGITVNAVLPGLVHTEIVASASPDIDQLTKSWPSIPAESIASTIAFLASDEAADVSGEEIGIWRAGPVGV